MVARQKHLWSHNTHILIHVLVLIFPAFGCAVADSKFLDLGCLHFYRAVGPVSNLDILCPDVARRSLELVDAIAPVPIPLAIKADVIS